VTPYHVRFRGEGRAAASVDPGQRAEQADTVCQPIERFSRRVRQTRSTACERASVLNQVDILSEILAWKAQDGWLGVFRIGSKFEI
jgi:hypothetical protein